MLIPRVARRYAQAIYEAVPPDIGRERFFGDLSDLKRSLENSSELRAFFASPIIANAKKIETVRALFTGRLTSFTVDTLLFLLEKNREDLLMEIIVSLFDLDREEKGVKAVRVTASRDLDAAQKQSLEAVVSAMTRTPIEAEFLSDDSLIGGLVVRVGDVVYDGSVKRQLQLLRERFLAGTV